MISQYFLLTSILISFTITEGQSSSPYNPTDVFLFNCGDTSDNLDSGRNWTAENRKTLPSNSQNASFLSNANSQESGVSLIPYMKARIFRSDFTYSFPVTSGPKFLRLYFYPTRYGSDFDAGTSFFTVTVNGFTLLKNFSAGLTVKASKEFTVVKEFIIPVYETTLNLTFTPFKNSLAFVNGIEVVSMPDRFYSKGGFDDVISNVGSDVVFELQNLTALETVYRLNVAGQPIRDTGMFRRWISDDKFIMGGLGTVPNVPGVKINYTAKTPAYVAPDDVYATCRMMGNPANPKLNVNFNLTWIFPVDTGFNYLVRLHFCEIIVDVTKPGQRVFSIYLGEQMAKQETDVLWLSGGSRNPMYLDFNVYVGSGSDLRLDLHPFAEIKPMFLDVILNGVEILKMSDSDRNLAGPNPNPETSPTPNTVTPSKRKRKSNVMVIVLALVGSAIVLGMCVVVVVMLLIKKKKKKAKEFSVHTMTKPTDSWTPLTGSTNTRSATSILPSDLCHRFSIREIRAATNDFEEKLIVGVGGFGPVYKGRIDGGTTLVAVKRLSISSHQGVKEFETELEMLSVLRHVHLVSLIGYCDDENEMVLVYEYMPRGTVKDHLYKRDKVNDPPLSWKQRLEICIGAARGLQYLHTGAKDTIIHRDIKTTNILLDENYVAKVSDFGLSKVGPTSASQTHVSTVVKGTFGYLDPEYYRRQVLTDKSDVYSFGVVMFEVLCSRPIKIENVKPEEAHLVRWVKSNYEKGTVGKIIDSDLKADITPTSLEKFCEIGVRCVEDRGIERPSMNDVVWGLEFALQLHESSSKKKNAVEFTDMPRGDVGMTTTDGEDDLFSTTTGGHVSKSTDDDSALLVGGDKRSGSSWGVFSEIKEPKAR
ncbi:hypothetical protein AALP_AA6G345300 [Arabis alpina]|uniref:Protein kinase domain-containing protein n=1 Tax=Arabis alpina TaxID=50452 RepID=A0A087GTL1_ARAAL|nr:hypothetical protein AALP_AA6G345300 [Arabis alpina]